MFVFALVACALGCHIQKLLPRPMSRSFSPYIFLVLNIRAWTTPRKRSVLPIFPTYIHTHSHTLFHISPVVCKNIHLYPEDKSVGGDCDAILLVTEVLS